MGSSARLRLANSLHRLLPERPDVSVDLMVPLSRTEAFMEWYAEAIGHYPIWCVPYRHLRDQENVAEAYWAGIGDELFLDLAIEGMPQPEGRNIYLELEEALPDHDGLKALSSFNYYDEDTFWHVFDRANYEAVKAITDPDNVFRDLYDKTCLAPRGLERD
jgi:hypothetical protein